MGLTVKDLIEELEKHDPNAKIVTITVGNKNGWDYTSNPKITTNSNMFGKTVWIQ